MNAEAVNTGTINERHQRKTFVYAGFPCYIDFPFSSDLHLASLIAFAVGAGIPVLLPVTLVQLQYLLAIAIVLFVLLVCYQFMACREKVVARAVFIISALVLGTIINMSRLALIVEDQLPVEREGEEFEVTLMVTGLPELDRLQGSKGSRQRAVFAARIEQGADVVANRLVRLSWYSPPQNLKPGDRWHLTVRLKAPRGTANPHGFDYQAWLLARGFRAVGYVRDQHPLNQLEPSPHWSFDQLRFQLRKQLFNRDWKTGALLKALLLGDKSELGSEHWRVLQASGTVHLMAISGLHIGLVAGLCFWVGKVLAHLLGLVLRINWLWLAPLFSLLSAFFYAGLAGFALPTQRALIMVCLFALGLASGRRLNYWAVFFAAMSLVVLLDPFAFLSSGFWLSFCAVAVLVFCLRWRIQRASKWVQMIRAQWWLMLGMLLPLAMSGLPSTLLAPVSNLIAVPIVSFSVIPLLLSAALLVWVVPEASLWLMQMADWILSFVWTGLAYTTEPELGLNLNPLLFFNPLTSFLGVIAALVAVLLVLTPLGLRLRLLGVALYAVTLLSRPQPAALRLTAVDVQQGLGMTLVTPGYVFLYDAGPSMGEGFDMGNRAIAPYLRSLGKANVDTLIVSHGDNDHAGGAASLLELFHPQHILAGEPERLSAAPAADQCHAGMHWRHGELDFDVLWPPAFGYNTTDSNNKSCIVQVSYYNNVILFTGDIDKTVERELLDSGMLPERIDILVAAHHGSRSSSSPAFVEHLRPQFVVISAGYRNRYRLPSEVVLNRWQAAGATILRTDLHGAIEFIWNDKHQLRVTRERVDSPKPWYL